MAEPFPHELHSPGDDHSVIAMTFAFSVMLALLVASMFAFGNAVSRVMAVAIVCFTVPVLVRSLDRRAAHDRDHDHPSR